MNLAVPPDPVSFQPSRPEHYFTARIHAAIDLLAATERGRHQLESIGAKKIFIELRDSETERASFTERNPTSEIYLTRNFTIPMLSEAMAHELGHAELADRKEAMYGQMATVADYGAVRLVDEANAWAAGLVHARALKDMGIAGP